MAYFAVVKSVLRATPGLSSHAYPFLANAVFVGARWLRRISMMTRRGKLSAARNLEPDSALVIEIAYGGLGDSLLHSHLPRLAKGSGKYSTVYLSNVTPFRNSAHRRVVWELNPHVDGFVDEPGILFEDLLKRKGVSRFKFQIHPGLNVLDEIMLAYGFDDGGRFHEPELYYKPKILPEYSGKVIYDPNWVSPVNEGISSVQIEQYFARNGVKIDMQFEPRGNSRRLASCPHQIRDQSFEEFCDIVHSCADIYCFATGTAALASALRKKAHVFYHKGIKDVFLFSRLHNYIYLDT